MVWNSFADGESLGCGRVKAPEVEGKWEEGVGESRNISEVGDASKRDRKSFVVTRTFGCRTQGGVDLKSAAVSLFFKESRKKLRRRPVSPFHIPLRFVRVGFTILPTIKSLKVWM